MRTISPEEMRRVESRAIAAAGADALTLMERAAEHVAEAARPYRTGGALWVACGAGNNGGDGMAAARLLLEANAGLRATVWRLDGPETDSARVQRKRLEAFGSRVTWADIGDAAEAPACVIDAILGTGLSRAPEGAAAALIARVNGCGAPVVAADIPSGLDGATGRAYPACVTATVTVTFHRPKPGLFLGDGLDRCGRVIVGDIGLPPEYDDADGPDVLMPGDALLPPRARLSHKGTYGRALAIAGSPGMAGAAALCATAALRTGAGLMTVACPKEIMPTVQALCPCATCLPLESDIEGAWAALAPALERADAIALGCGLGQGALATALAARVTDWLAARDVPAVLDADALNLLAARADAPRLPDCAALTPHPAEAARLLGSSVADVLVEPFGAARALRARYGGMIVLKGAASVLVAADGEAINPYGTPGMAKGGSGDALTGALLALMAGRKAYGLSGVRLMQTACALHGLAGRAAAAAHGERGMLATELCEALGRVPSAVPEGAGLERANLHCR